MPGPETPAAVLFDVDGVLVASPHERAWRDALVELMADDWRASPAPDWEPTRFTTAVYQRYVAGRDRLSGARAALEHFHVPDAARRAVEYAARKQRKIDALIRAGEFQAFDDGIRLVVALKSRGMLLGVASSSKNANDFMQRIPLDGFVRAGGIPSVPIVPGLTLDEVFDANVCGADVAHGKPAPDLFLLAADALGAPPARCVVVEDAPSGVQAAKAGGMTAVGVARLDDAPLLRGAGADLVVTTLDDVPVDALVAGELARPARGEARP
jgi:beta-phosphoglucomutase